jgi:hypothetical protein
MLSIKVNPPLVLFIRVAGADEAMMNKLNSIGEFQAGIKIMRRWVTDPGRLK